MSIGLTNVVANRHVTSVAVRDGRVSLVAGSPRRREQHLGAFRRIGVGLAKMARSHLERERHIGYRREQLTDRELAVSRQKTSVQGLVQQCPNVAWS